MDAVVLDHGSSCVRAGIANPDSDPPLILSSELCRVNGDEPLQVNSVSTDSTTEYGFLQGMDVVQPIERGKIVNWDAMEDIWRFIFYEQLGWDPGSEGPVLVAEPLQTPKITRERMVQVMFETFNCNGYYSVEQALLSLYAVGRLTGCTVDIGHGKTEITPIVEGAIQQSAFRQMDLGGQDLDKLLLSQLLNSYPQLKLDTYALRNIKEKCCTVSPDADAYDLTESSCKTEEHRLPDGQVINIGRERMMVGEGLFRPKFLGMEEYGLPEQLLRCVTLGIPPESQKQIIENVVLVGGVSVMSGFEERFMGEATLASPPSLRPAIVKAPEYMPDNTIKNGAWMGGAILAKVVFPQNQHISKAEYDEVGPSMVHKKCF